MSNIRNIWPEIQNYGPEIDEQIEINSHYKGYLKKQKADILAFKRDENLSIPENIDYDQFSGLSNEVKLNLSKLGQKQWVKLSELTVLLLQQYIFCCHMSKESLLSI